MQGSISQNVQNISEKLDSDRTLDVDSPTMDDQKAENAPEEIKNVNIGVFKLLYDIFPNIRPKNNC